MDEEINAGLLAQADQEIAHWSNHLDVMVGHIREQLQDGGDVTEVTAVQSSAVCQAMHLETHEQLSAGAMLAVAMVRLAQDGPGREREALETIAKGVRGFWQASLPLSVLSGVGSLWVAGFGHTASVLLGASAVALAVDLGVRAWRIVLDGAR